MNHDDHQPPNPDLHPFIEPELEARVVACVLGEASAFEAAEVERLCVEQPELAIFQRRIAAVHGLAAKATRPEMQPLRLAPERRAKLLQAISAKAESGTAPTVHALNPKQPRQRRWFGGLVAGLAIGGILAVLAVPGARLLEDTFDPKPLRPNPSQTTLEGRGGGDTALQGVEYYSDPMMTAPSPSADAASPPTSGWGAMTDERRKEESRLSQLEAQRALIADSERRKAERTAREELRRSESLLREAAPINGGSFADAVTALTPPAPARPKPTDTIIAASPSRRAAPPPPTQVGGLANNWSSSATESLSPNPVEVNKGVDGDETMSLSPFVVTASEDVGYSASNTLAGTRIRTDLRDIGSAISVITPEFLKDVGTTDNQTVLQYKGGTEVGGASGNFGSIRNDEQRTSGSSAWEPGFLQNTPARPNPVLFGQAGGGTAATTPAEFKQEQGRIRGLDAAENNRDAFSAEIPWESYNSSLNQPLLGELDDRDGRQETEKFKWAPSDYEARMTVADLEVLVKERKVLGRHALRRTLGGKPDAAAPDEISTATEPTSTFSLHVSDVSFRLAQAALARGELPDPARIRPEEFYNAFDYGDPAPAAAEKIACRIEQAAHPVLQQRNLVRIAVRVPATGRGAGQPLRLTVLLDTSGSMERADRAASVRRAMEVLGSLLGPNDRVTVIGFARQPRLLVEALPGDQAATRLAELAAQTPAEGGTNLEAALELALTKAQQYFDAAAQNRVVLITDGAANLGNANPERLAEKIAAARERGLAFDACGVGTDGLDDAVLEALTRKGDGRYYVLDSPEDADAGFARQLAGAFRPAAQNVKLQVRFNPARVAHYRLIGFEQHRLREEDFRNDKVDAAELAAEEAAVAVYQVAVLPDGEGELGDVFVRFRDTAANEMVERSWTMPFEARARAFDQATPSVQLAGVAALLAEKLRGGAMADLVRFDELAPVVNVMRGRYASNARVQELVTMFEQARRMAGE